MNKFDKRKFILCIIKISLFALLILSMFLPQFQLKDLNQKYNLLNLLSGEQSDGYQIFEISVPVVIDIVLAIGALICSIYLFVKKINKDFWYNVIFIVVGMFSFYVAIGKKSYVKFTILNNDMISQSILLWGSYFMSFISIAIILISFYDILSNSKDNK